LYETATVALHRWRVGYVCCPNPVDSTTLAWFWLAGVEVLASKQTGAIVTFGDSITDGTRSTADANNRWPDHRKRLKGEMKNEKSVEKHIN
jgi:hypothetical protein